MINKTKIGQNNLDFIYQVVDFAICDQYLGLPDPVWQQDEALR